MALSKTARVQANRAIRAIVRDYDDLDPPEDLDQWLADASYDESRRVTTIGTFDESPTHNRVYTRWMEWRTTVEREARATIVGDGQPDGRATAA